MFADLVLGFLAAGIVLMAGRAFFFTRPYLERAADRHRKAGRDVLARMTQTRFNLFVGKLVFFCFVLIGSFVFCVAVRDLIARLRG